MNVIFLDFNGVLDTYDNFDIIDISNLHILIDAINLTNSKVVITSSNKDYFYRNGRHNNIMNNLINVLKSYNVCVLGYTKKLNSREEEIIEYLCSHPEIEHYCIIDDDYFFESMSDHMIKLTSQNDGGNGLVETTSEEIVRKLNI
jgi:uncharacterized Zn-finger protein